MALSCVARSTDPRVAGFSHAIYTATAPTSCAAAAAYCPSLAAPDSSGVVFYEAAPDLTLDTSTGRVQCNILVPGIYQAHTLARCLSDSSGR